MSQSQEQQNNRNYIISLGRDVATVASIGILLICVHELGQPFVRGFYCDDETIRYPHRESTVSSTLCYATGTLVNVVAILLLEYRSLLNDLKGQREANQPFPTRLYTRRVYYQIIVWSFGAIASELITDISKVTAGRLRPHFLSVCQPIIELGDGRHVKVDDFCNSEISKHQYITDYTCAGSPSKIRDTRMSFISGHSSYSAYSATFVILYLQTKLDFAQFGLLKSGFQVLIGATAFYVGLTRVADYKHHWQDVLAGLLEGTLMASVVSLCLRPAYLKSHDRYMKRESRIDGGELGSELNRVTY